MGGINNLRNLIGQTFGNLTVMRHVPRYGVERRKGFNALWLCRCVCGREVRVPSDKLILGRKKSCAIAGHIWRGPPREPGVTALYRSEYNSWRSMMGRCFDQRQHNYANYGGRGIGVCERWLGFSNFLEDMGSKPTPWHTIERLDNDRGYEPGNCRWATRKEQSRNQRRSVYIELGGRRELLIDACGRYGLPLGLVYGRLKNGWSIETALSTPAPIRMKCPDCGKTVRKGAKHVCQS